jgi:hypothetical protein
MAVTTKKQIMISIDIRILEKFDILENNRSNFIERAMLQRINGIMKKDMPEEVLTLKCSVCGKSVTSGYWCEEKRKFFCEKCNTEKHKLPDGTKFEKWRCGCKGAHEHIKIPGYDNSRIDLFNQIKNYQNGKSK